MKSPPGRGPRAHPPGAPRGARAAHSSWFGFYLLRLQEPQQPRGPVEPAAPEPGPAVMQARGRAAGAGHPPVFSVCFTRNMIRMAAQILEFIRAVSSKNPVCACFISTPAGRNTAELGLSRQDRSLTSPVTAESWESGGVLLCSPLPSSLVPGHTGGGVAVAHCGEQSGQALAAAGQLQRVWGGATNNQETVAQSRRCIGRSQLAAAAGIWAPLARTPIP